MPAPSLDVPSTERTRTLPLADQPVTSGRRSTHLGGPAGDGQASRSRCVIEKIPEGVRVRDLDSSNGTRLNGKLVKTAMLGDGDTVTVGKTQLKLVAPQLAAAGAAGGARKRGSAQVAETNGDDEYEVEVEVVVEVEEEPIDQTGGADFERQLLRVADSLADKKYNDYDIALINTRGQVAHPARTGAAPKKQEPREAVWILRQILLICFRTRASDIHVEPKQDDFSVRIRVDGSMVDVARLPKDMGTKLMSLVKIMCDIDIAQRNIVQEGHFSSKVPDRRVDYRVRDRKSTRLNSSHLVISYAV